MQNTESKSPVKPISCEECRELLSDYVDRELTADERKSVEQHLQGCAKCGTESTRMTGLKQIVQHWDGVKGSGEFRKSVMEKMIRESQQITGGQFKNVGQNGDAPVITEDDTPADIRSLPPVWIILVAIVLALAGYYIVMALRGM